LAPALKKLKQVVIINKESLFAKFLCNFEVNLKQRRAHEKSDQDSARQQEKGVYLFSDSGRNLYSFRGSPEKIKKIIEGRQTGFDSFRINR
jgi:hypothetical protein